MGFSIYFDVKKDMEGNHVLGVVVQEGYHQFPAMETKVEDHPDYTQYEPRIDALLYALDIIEEEGYDEVNLYHQEKLIFEWIGKEHDNPIRAEKYKKVNEALERLTEDGITIEAFVIKGKDNKAKKHLNKKYKSASSVKKRSFSLTGFR